MSSPKFHYQYEEEDKAGFRDAMKVGLFILVVVLIVLLFGPQ